MRIKKIPLPDQANNGNSSFKLVAGVRSVVEKSDDDRAAHDAAAVEELIATVFGARGISLVPA